MKQPWTLANWKYVLAMVGRQAMPDDVERGAGIFHQREDAAAIPMQLPCPAILRRDDGQRVAVVIVQAERASDDPKVVIYGMRDPSGASHMAMENEVSIVKADNPDWRRMVEGA